MSDAQNPEPELGEAIAEMGGDTLYWCMQCGLCTGGCPWRLTDGEINEEFNARKLQHQGQLGLEGYESDNNLFACTTCGICVKRCPREVNAIDNIQAVRLDVTKQQDIDAAVRTVTEAGRGLHGLVNNAGVAVILPLIEIEEQDFDFQMAVNLYGPFRVTKAFAPLIIESKGRITTTGSISGILSSTLFGPYSMSKHAMEAYTDALAAEMMMVGSPVKVSSIAPGNYKSKIAESACRRVLETGQLDEESRWPAYNERMVERCKDASRSQYPEPDDVADAALHAMFAENPKEHYMVVPVRSEAEWTIYKALEEVVEGLDAACLE